MNKKKVLVLAGLACVLALCIALLGPGGEKKTLQGEMLTNGNFALLDDNGMPSGWYTDEYVHTPGYTDYSAENGVVTIVNHELNDARFVQRVDVNPDSLYCFSGYVRANAAEGLGANLSIEGIYVFSDSFYDTGDEWKEVRLYGRTGENQRSVTVYARLGGYSGEAVGSASFRDLSLCEVSSVPVGYVASNWYAAQPAPAPETDGESASAWPVLLLIAAVYTAVCFCLRRRVLEDGASLRGEGRMHPVLLTVFMLLLAAAVRIVIAAAVPGYGVDVGCFTAWANMMAQNGAADFYVSDMFCDYPPGYILVLGVIGQLGKMLGTGATEMMIKMPSIICDVAAAAVLYAFARKYISERAAFTVSALYAFNPLTVIAGAAWGQADSVMALFILLVVVLAIENRWYAALPVYMIAVLMKPQALMFGPLGLLALAVLLIRNKDKKLIRDALIGLGLAVLAGLAIVVPFSVKQENPLWIVELYSNTMGYYDSATINACNLHFLLGNNWVPVENSMPLLEKLLAMAILFAGTAAAVYRGKLYRMDLQQNADRVRLGAYAAMFAFMLCIAFIPMTYAAFGTACIVFVVLGSALVYVAGNDVRHLPLLGGMMLIALCNLGVMMHERYLFAGVLLLFVSCVLHRDRRVYILCALLTASVFLNVGVVLDRGVRIGGVEGHLDAPLFGIASDSAWLEYVVSALNCVLTAAAVYTSVMICCAGQVLAMQPKQETETHAEETLPVFNRAKASLQDTYKLPRMKKPDWLLMLSVTLVYAVVSFVNLGSTTSPQTMWTSTTRDETIVLDLGKTRTMNMLYFGGIHNVDSDFYVQVSDDGYNWDEGFWGQMSYGDCFKWQYIVNTYEYDEQVSYGNTPREITARYVMITARQLGTTLYEVVLRDPDTQEVFASTVIEGNGEALIDEPDAFHGEPSWYNSTYFDEIYHARTGYEHYMAMQGDNTYFPYETSHPPLGKVLIAFSIAVFGMTPFGWRFAGALAGVMMLPGMYMLGKYLTKRRSGAFAAMLLMAVDLMHFTQTRIATIDSFVVLFIIWSYVFMIYYIRMDYWHTKLWKTLVPLALSGLFMGLSVASKWTGCYAGVGLAVLFFWSVWRRFEEYRYAKGALAQHNEKLSKKERKNRQPLENEAVLTVAANEGLKRPFVTLLSCLGFFVAVPLLVYYVSYIPYFMPSGGITVERVIQAAVGDYFKSGVMGGMLGYHGTPGLGMDHPFYTPWYEWPIIGKPMWYYSSSYHPDGYSQTIVAMGNPAVWLGGLFAFICVAVVCAARHVTRRGIVLHSADNDMRPAIILISFAAQYLPWVLVPRGTYIYHYFTAVPFIITAVTLCFDYLMDVTEKPLLVTLRGSEEQKEISLRKAVWTLLIGYLLVSVVLFVAFYPYASGAMTDIRWLRAMQWFPGWIYY